MDEVTIDIIHRSDSKTPSLKNLLQGLRAVDEPWEISVYSLRSELPTETKVSEVMELATFSVNLFKKYLQYKRSSPDILIIHKALYGDIISKITRRDILEKLFLNFDNTVYSTYDADYVHFPRKTELLFKRSDLIIATSRQIEQKAQEYSPAERIELVPPSVDTDFFDSNKPIPKKYDSDSMVLGWIGNAQVHQDNLRHLAECLKNIESSDVTVRLLLGGKSLPPSIHETFTQMEADLDIIGYVKWEEVPVVINSFDVGLAPLTDTEFNRARSSEKIREYMACGVPVIASDLGENPHLVSEEAGILVETKEEWANAVKTLSEAKTRSRMSQAARQHVEENYAIPVVAEQLRETLVKLLS